MNFKNNVEKKIEKLTSDLSSEELVPIIQKLTTDYYISYFEGNPEKANNISELLNTLASNNDSYNIKCYINYCLLASVNSLISKTNDAELLTPFEISLVEKKSELLKKLERPLPELEPEPYEMDNEIFDVLGKAFERRNKEKEPE